MISPIKAKEKTKAKTDHTLLDSKKKDPFIPSEQFLLLFRQEWTDYFRNFDDGLIPVIQFFHIRRNSVIKKFVGFFIMIFAYIMTFFTQIEYGPSLCVFFITIGYDHVGRWLLIITMITALVAQFPKRFLFRKRPFMDKRALQIGKDNTSSFPSRSAVCGIVYAFAVVTAYNYQVGIVRGDLEKQFSLIHMALIIIFGGLAASVGRIHLGVHYPSDCVCGMAMGVLICAASYVISFIPNIFGCPSCYQEACYPDSARQLMTNENFVPQNVQLVIMLIVITGVLQVFSNWPPLKFWDKSAPIFGTFCACIAAELMMVCPKTSGKGLASTGQLESSGYIYAFIITQANLLLSVLTTKVYRRMKKMSWNKAMIWNIVVYLLFALVFLVLIITTRLSITFPAADERTCEACNTIIMSETYVGECIYFNSFG